MLKLFEGLNPLETRTGCFFVNKKAKNDILISDFIQNAWDNNLNFMGSITATYQAIVGNHLSLATERRDCEAQQHGEVQTFKGALDFLILPLVARRLWNWSFIQMQVNNNSLSMELAISTARVFSMAVSLARILVGVALTLALTPVVGLICLLRHVNNKPVTSESNDVDEAPNGCVEISLYHT